MCRGNFEGNDLRIEELVVDLFLIEEEEFEIRDPFGIFYDPVQDEIDAFLDDDDEAVEQRRLEFEEFARQRREERQRKRLFAELPFA